MNAEIIIIAFTFIVMLSVTPARYYFLIVSVVLAFMALVKLNRSEFAAAATPSTAIAAETVDLDSAADIDQALSRREDVTNGDDLLSGQMRVVGQQAKAAILNRARFTSDNFRGVFQEELDAGEHRDWWEDDGLAAGTVKNEEKWEA